MTKDSHRAAHTIDYLANDDPVASILEFRALTDEQISQAHNLPIPKAFDSISEIDCICESLREKPLYQQFCDTVQPHLPRLFACSAFAEALCRRSPDLLLQENLLNQPVHLQTASFNQLRGSLEGELNQTEFMAQLRQQRNAQMLGIIWRDLILGTPVCATLEDLSYLADRCVELAHAFSQAALVQRFGEARDADGVSQRLIVLAMGKLGGRELNFSSDIDLILIYPHKGSTDGSRQIDNSEFFKKQAQMMVRLLSHITEDGFVFRVDLRLRPFGESGALVINFDAVEHYYLTQGREWERYAMIKARALCGAAEDRHELMQMLTPFVYRRYLDYNAIASLRDLKTRISAEVSNQGMQNNIKLGIGGIREIEFIGQAFQLVRGGREPGLQKRSIIQVLHEVARLGLLAKDEVSALIEAYCFLRRTENCLQMVNDQQVHTLPVEVVGKSRLAFAMGYPEWNAYRQDLDRQLSIVQTCFQALFQLDTEVATRASNPFANLSISIAQNKSEIMSALEQRGYERASDIFDVLDDLLNGAFFRNLSDLAQRRVDQIVPLLLRSALPQTNTFQAIDGLLKFVRCVAGRSAYLQVLSETPAAIELLARLFSRSSWIGEFVSKHPIVIDELLDHRQIAVPPDYDALEQEVAFMVERVAQEELDVQMDAARHFKQAATMRIAVADLEDKLSLMQVSDRLTWVAELALQAASDLVWDQLVKSYGKPSCKVQGKLLYPGFAILAYGKLGGSELGYGSDLDLVFLHESEGEAQVTTGSRRLENPVFYAKLAQKVVHFLSTFTPAGTMYEIDTRLRPNGQAGLLVSSFDAFASYQENDAWIWEHQALVRARAVVGNERIRHRFVALRQTILCRSRDSASLQQEVVSMRHKMIAALASSDEIIFDLKQDAGGIADIEFMVQYLVLAYSSAHPELALETDNVRILEWVSKLGLLSPDKHSLGAAAGDVAIELRDTYLAYRGLVHQRALLEQSTSVVPEPDLLARRSRVRAIWDQIMLAR